MFWQLFTLFLPLCSISCQELGFPGATNSESLDNSENIDENGCQTLKGQNCILPFTYQNVSYSGCITINDPNNLPWCSIKVSFNKKCLK